MARAEVLCIGTELLLGDVLDTNSQYLAQQLALLGLDCFYQVTVGDNPERIIACMRQALSRADILITTGGLGPTADDLTTQCVADAFGGELEMDEEVLAYITGLFTARGFPMPESNRKQALRPRGADILPNPVGSAPGMIWRLTPGNLAFAGLVDARDASSSDSPSHWQMASAGQSLGDAGSGSVKSILTFPGVPSEMRGMWQETARGYLEKNYAGGTIWSKELKHYGIGESALAEMNGHLLELANPTVAPYAGHWECRLRVAAKAPTREEAEALARPVIEEIKKRSGVRCYGEDSDTLESVVGRLLTEKGLTLATAESCTGGLVSQRLTDVPGSSNYIVLNAVTYANGAKVSFLGVPQEIIDTHGAVSPECARAMAEGMRKLAGADIAVSITGVAGPGGGTDEKPVGTVYVGLSAADDFYFGRLLKLGARLSRSEIRWRTANDALNMVRLFLLDPAYLKE